MGIIFDWFSNSNLQSLIKYLEQIKEIKQSLTEPVNFVIFFCVTFICYWQVFFLKGRLGTGIYYVFSQFRDFSDTF